MRARRHRLSWHTAAIGLGAALALAAASCQRSTAPQRAAKPLEDDTARPAQASEPPGAERAERSPALPSTDDTDLMTLRPQRTRDGQLRFAQEHIHDNPAATQAFLRRLRREGAAEMRAALVEALPRTGGEWFHAAMAHLEQEPEPMVRKAIVAIMVQVEAGRGARGILRGLGDPAPSVRAEAAIAAGSLPPTTASKAGLVTKLQQRLSDPDAHTRAGAARSLGILGAAESFAAIEPLLADAAAAVRLQALRALGRLDADRTARLSAIESLRSDPDARVARAANRLAPQ